MIILEGTDLDLKAEVSSYLTMELQSEASYHISSSGDRNDLKSLVKVVHANNMWQVREGLDLSAVTPAARHMLATALASTGTVVIFCGHAPDMLQLDHYNAIVPIALITPHDNAYDSVQFTLRNWRHEVERARLVYEYCSAGGLHRSAVMLVGEQAKNYVPCDEGRRIAFTSYHGCSLFLHEALLPHKGVRYYLTNAHKCDVQKSNRKMLTEELELVKPSKVVALGEAAARMLSDVGATFTRTYHPQYWKRFKNKELPQLVELLAP